MSKFEILDLEIYLLHSQNIALLKELNPFRVLGNVI